ncbi:MAG: LysM peptidoglycan-binding domain-containing protein [Acidiferrobacterales bacterium]
MSAARNAIFAWLVLALIALPGTGLGQTDQAVQSEQAAPAEPAAQTEQVEVIESGDIVQLKPDHPTRYTVVKGDTLWDIASRFLRSPWHWPKIWTINDQIANPHLIYPGDVIVLRFVEGRPELTVVERPAVPAPVPAPLPEGELAPPPAVRPGPIVQEFEGVEGAPRGRVVKLSPRVVEKPLAKPVPTISPDMILPWLTKPLVVDRELLKKSGYVTIGLDDRIALGDGSEFYARGLPKTKAEFYQLYRKGQEIKDPGTKKRLGWEAIYLGDAMLLEPGDPSKFIVTRVRQEILPRDELFIAPAKVPLPYFFPHAPEFEVRGRILTALNSVNELGPMTVVSVNVGRGDGIEEGHVLRVMRRAGRRRDPVTRKWYELPDEPSGLMMVFRTFEKMSYGLVINANRPIHILDDVITP